MLAVRLLIVSLLIFSFRQSTTATLDLKETPTRTQYSNGFTQKRDVQKPGWLSGLSSVNVLGLANFAFSQFTGTYKDEPLKLNNAVVHILPKHLALLLQFNGKFVSNTSHVPNHTFFEKFFNFFVSFDGTAENDLLVMSKLLKLASGYNLKQKQIRAPRKLHLWIAIPAEKDIETAVFHVVDIITNANLLSSQTVTSLLLNYRSLHVTAESIPLINQDIKMTKHLIESKVGRELKVGIILELHNCPKFLGASPLDNLELENRDDLVFMSQLYSDENEMNVISPAISCFYGNEAIKAKIWLQIPIKSVINLESSSFTLEMPGRQTRDFYAFSPKFSNNANFIIKAEIQQLLPKKVNTENSTKNKNIDSIWLAQEPVFDKVHFGVSIYPPSQTNLFSSVVAQASSTFRKIIVETQDVSSSSNLNTFVSSLGGFNVARVREEVQKGELTRNDIPVQLLVLANINYKNSVKSSKSVKAAFGAALLANMEYPEIATVMLSLDALHDDKHEIGNEQEILLGRKFAANNFMPRVKGLLPAIEAFQNEIKINSDKKDYFPKVGIMSEFCMELTMVGATANFLSSLTSVNYSQQDMLLLKVVVKKTDIVEHGAARAALSVIHASRNCEIMMFLYKKVVKFNIYTQLIGCSNDRDEHKNNNANIYELTAEAKFWELLNSWAYKENKTVFMGTGFEYKRTATLSSHRIHFYDCGWWKLEDSSSANTSGIGDRKWSNQKSIAAKLYEELNAPTETKRHYDKSIAKFGSMNKKLLLIIFIPTLIFAVGVVIFSAFCISHYRAKYVLTGKEVSNFVRGEPVPLDDNGEENAACSQPYKVAKYEVYRGSFQIDFTKCLGTGEFANVMCGSIKRHNEWIPVAVKMMKQKRPLDGSSSSHGQYLALKGLISEIKILSFVGEHKNVVKMEGACTAKIRSGKLLIFLEKCELGSLEKYLRNYHSSIAQRGVERQEDVELTAMTLESEMSQDLHRWSIEIASGMEYLSSKKVVHADLATRNVLLNSAKCAKISDFGLSRRLYDYSEYIKTEVGPLPWRWMAPESLTRMIFNEQTDVWAFGVTLWEMYSLGDEPYPGLAWNMSFPTMLERGLRLNEPRFNENNIFNLMRECWEGAPCDRPAFAQLKVKLQDNLYDMVL